MFVVRFALVFAIVLALAPSAFAQSLGTFRWQLRPFCNVVTLAVTAFGGGFRVEGTDDQCGSATPASAIGTAFLNADGSVGLGLTIVTAPQGENVHLIARLDLGTLNGFWRDSGANGGAFIFTPGAGNGGEPRPRLPAVRPGSITSDLLAPGAVTSAHLAPGVVGAGQIDRGQVQARVVGTCGVGQYVRGINPDGSVICAALAMPNVSRVVDGSPEQRVGGTTALAVGADGLPLMAYRDNIANALRVLHCGNISCTAGNLITNADALAGIIVGLSASVAIGADGLPIVSYLAGNGLRVTHCGNVACSTGNVSTTVDNPPGMNVGVATSIAIGVDGLPVISHSNVTSNALRVTHCGNVACTAGNVSTDVDDPPGLNVGLSSSIAIGIDGLPVISHHDGTVNGLRVTHCGNAACTAGTISTTVDDPANTVGSSSTLAIGADGLPVIAHLDVTAFALRVTHCGNAACTAGALSTTVDDPPANAVGFQPSIAIGADGLAIISHQQDNPVALRVTHCGNAACTAGTVTTLVDSPGERTGDLSSIAISGDGLPLISHASLGLGTVRLTMCGSRTCQ